MQPSVDGQEPCSEAPERSRPPDASERRSSPVDAGPVPVSIDRERATAMAGDAREATGGGRRTRRGPPDIAPQSSPGLHDAPDAEAVDSRWAENDSRVGTPCSMASRPSRRT